MFDVNSDGVISKKEMKRLVKDMYGLLKKEDPNISAADLIAKSAFAEMDKDEDGKISLDEFTTAVLTEKDFSRLLSSTALDIFMEEEKTEWEIWMKMHLDRAKYISIINDQYPIHSCILCYSACNEKSIVQS